MKRLILTLILTLLIMPTILAINLSIEKIDSQEVIIKGINQPATFNLEITNNQVSDDFTFFNLLGFAMEPTQKVSINNEETKEIELVIYPREDLTIKNYYTFQYFIKGTDSSEQSEKLTIKLVDLKDAFNVGTSEIDPESNSLNVYIQNKENFDFKNLDVRFNSKFFDFEENFDLDAKEKKEFNLELDKDNFKELLAGFYTVTATLKIENLSEEIEGTIKFVEKDFVETIRKDIGFIVGITTIEKINNGNTISQSATTIEKNIISRLFTNFSPEPDIVDRRGFSVFYTWNKDIKPGETLKIVSTTNWLFPLLLIIFIVAIVIMVKRYTATDVLLRKKVSFVKAKGGQFALKVTLFIQANNYVERVNIIDRLPSLMKIYEKFGGEKPSRVDQGNRLIEWDLEKLESGEVRTISYIIYSKNVGVMGKFALPSATAIYQKEGEIKESTSNKAFFVTEQRKEDLI